MYILFQPGSQQRKSDTDLVSMKSGKSGESEKSEDKKSKISSKKASTPEKKEEFVVGKSSIYLLSLFVAIALKFHLAAFSNRMAERISI